MFNQETFRSVLIPQISCGDEGLRNIMLKKFEFLYKKNFNLNCDTNLAYLKVKLDLLNLALHSVREKVDFLKRVEDTKSDRFYDSEGFTDTTATRKAQGQTDAFSRARSEQSFERFSESHDSARSDTKAEHHGTSESKGFDVSRTDGKGLTQNYYTSDGYSVGVGRGASCFASKNASESRSTTGNMMPDRSFQHPTQYHKLDCKFLNTELVSKFKLPSVGDLGACFTLPTTPSGIAEIFTCITETLTATKCEPHLTDVSKELGDLVGMSRLPNDTSDPKFKNRFFVNTLVPNITPALNEVGYRSGYLITEVPEIYTALSTVPIFYNAEALTKNVETSTCDRRFMTPSSAKSWQFSYSFGVGFFLQVAATGGQVRVDSNINASHSYKESEVCTTGSSRKSSDTSTENYFKDISRQESQGAGRTNERTANERNQERRGTSRRDAFSRHKSCSFSEMISCGVSHTESQRKSRSETTSFGDSLSRQEGHSQGFGKALNRTKAIVEKKALSQIFDNLLQMRKNSYEEYELALEISIGSQGYAVAERNVDFCEQIQTTHVLTRRNGSR